MRVTIDTTEVKGCCIKGCRSTKPVARHHKGCDNFIGKFNPKVAEQYHLFLDCCNVCDKHHMMIHATYFPVIKAHWDMSPAGALKLRQKLIDLCDRIIAGEVKLRKPSAEFKAKWRRRRRAWKRAMRRSRG